ncbi:MAG: FkbM family methyltransferase [Aulosira sp. ZfuVER01]|nr:FkbM family methyltransferase [Aulosira sp. ZfuVER01]MDZ8000759.1 FkbM family methyltransferase [Aulosira sp. DedVER01a]MDZ8055067.1 FkbM family methyltransferase [Aulosira sp. ZfuCHP01]
MFIKAKLREYLAKRLGVPEIPFALQRLDKVAFQPNYIFDVGAYKGDFTLSCLQVWPNAKIACFEALEERVNQLKSIASNNSNIQVFPGLLGAQTLDEVPLHEAETASSILVEHISQNFSVTFHPMWTVDQIVNENFSDRSPDLLKLDVQGYELEVLKGAENSLPGIQMILAEVNLLDIHQDVPLLAEVISWLSERDWVAYDICGLTRRPLDQALWQADFIFVPSHSPLRSDKRWAA